MQNNEKKRKMNATMNNNVKYLNPKADLTFKLVFGEHPDLVMSLLNALLPLADNDNEEDKALAREYVQRLWDVQPPTGKWRYYVGMVYFLSMLHVAGQFSI